MREPRSTCRLRWTLWRLRASSVTIVAVVGLGGGVALAADLFAAPFGTNAVHVAPSFRVDLDRANAQALALLPGIGPALAARIVDDRSRLGSFGARGGITRVRGIGPAITAGIDPYVVKPE